MTTDELIAEEEKNWLTIKIPKRLLDKPGVAQAISTILLACMMPAVEQTDDDYTRLPKHLAPVFDCLKEHIEASTYSPKGHQPGFGLMLRTKARPK